jgi:hypothetical protein
LFYQLEGIYSDGRKKAALEGIDIASVLCWPACPMQFGIVWVYDFLANIKCMA